MNFLRRHWPDLIISLLIVALLVGFGVVLLGGKGKLGASGGQTAATTAAPSTSTPPITTDNSTPAAQNSGGDSGTGSVSQTPATQGDTPAATSSGSSVIPQAPGDIPTIPAQPDQTAGSTADSAASGATSAASSAQNTDTQTQSTGALSAATGAQSDAGTQATSVTGGTAVPTISSDTPTRQQYRVSVGTFGSEAEGARSTQAITQLGYTVHFIPVTQGVVAQIGPFADEATTRRALADINRVYSGAILRSPAGASASATSTGAQSDQSQGDQAQGQTGQNTTAPATAADSSSTDPTQSDQAPPPDAPVYLQVGAFDQQDRAQTLVQQLKDLGYAPVVQAPPGRKVTVLVGPYTGAALTRTEARLSQNNIDHFRVR